MDKSCSWQTAAGDEVFDEQLLRPTTRGALKSGLENWIESSVNCSHLVFVTKDRDIKNQLAACEKHNGPESFHASGCLLLPPSRSCFRVPVGWWVCVQGYTKPTQWISLKLNGRMGSGSKRSPLSFGAGDPGI